MRGYEGLLSSDEGETRGDEGLTKEMKKSGPTVMEMTKTQSDGVERVKTEDK